MLDEDYWREWFEERAALLEYGAGMCRSDAENCARLFVAATRRRAAQADRAGDNPGAPEIADAAHHTAADHGDAHDTALRLDTGARHGHGPVALKPYAVAAARMGQTYLESMKILQQMLPHFKRKGESHGEKHATP